MKEMITKGIIKRVLPFVLSLVMVLALIPSVAMKVAAATASSGYTTDEYGLMEYRAMSNNVYDFKGYINSGWRQVTFANNGFSVGAYNGSGLNITSAPSFISNGQAIMVTYTVKNTSNRSVSNYRFFIAADTMIDGNDASTNAIEDDVVVMTNERTGVSLFALSSTEGGTAVATEYYDASVSYSSVVRGSDPSSVTSVASARDSAFVMYFPKETIAAGEQKEYTLVVGMGDARSIDTIIEQVKNSLNAAIDYVNENLMDLTPDGVYEVCIEGDASGTVYTFIASQDGTIPLAGKDENNKDYDFIGKKIVMVHKGNGTTTQDSDPVTVHVADRPVPVNPEVPANLPTDIDVHDVWTSANSIKVVAVEGQEYRIGTNGPWVSPAADGYATFTGLNSNTDYTIYTRVKATTSAPASLVSDGVVVTTWNMFAPTKTEYNGPYDGLFHELKVDANVEGATVVYSESLNGPYTSTPYRFKTGGEHKVYYRITKENYYNAYGVLTANIDYNLEAAKAVAKEMIDEEVGDDTSELVIAAANAAKAAIDAATTLEEVDAAVVDGIEAILEARALHILAEEKAAAKDIIDAEVDGDTSENVIAAANAAKAAIDAATSSAEVLTATNNGLNAIRAAKEANALAEAKIRAKADIDVEVAGDTNDNVVAAANAAKAAIDTATSLEDVAQKTAEGIEAIRAAKAANALAAAKAKAKEDIDEFVNGDTDPAVLAAANAAKAAIDAATTLEDVEVATFDGIEAIALIKGINALEAEREIAKDLIEAEVAGDMSDSVAAAKQNALEAIDAATTIEELRDATTAGIEAITAAKDANALEAAKKAARDIIDAEVAGDTSENVVAAANAAKEAINASTTIANVVIAADDGVAAIRAAKDANELAHAKKAAEADLDAQVGADTAENIAELLRQAKEAIDAATTLEDIARETARAMEAIEAAQEANALAAEKESAKAEIDLVVGTDTSENVIAAANAAKEAIDAATTAAEIAEALMDGIYAIDAAKAANALAEYKEEAKADIDLLVNGSTAPGVIAAANAAKEAIDAATSSEAVAREVLDAIVAIIEASTSHALTEEKNAAKDIIDAEVAGDTSENVIAVADAAKMLIDSATTSEEVLAATSNGVAAIKAAKEANALAEAKIRAKADIDIEVAGDTNDNVVAAANAAKAAIDAATTLEDVAQETANGIEAIRAAKAANALAEVKAKAKEDIDKLVNGDTDPDVLAAASAAKNAIDAATTLEGVEDATFAGIEAIALIKGINVLAAEKTVAKDIIEAEVAGDLSDLVKEAMQNALAAIDAATTPEEVKNATSAGIAAITAAKDANALEAAKKTAREIIDAEVAEDTSENVVAAANAAKDAINAATTIEDIVKAADDGVAAIRAAKDANALAQAKKAAEADLEAEVTGDTPENIAELIRKAKEAIDAATTLDEVAEETARAIEAIEAAKEANALATAKEAAKAAIDAEVDEDTSENVIAAANAAKEAIDAATTLEEVETATKDGIEAIKAAKAQNESEAPAYVPDVEVITEAVTIPDADEIIDITPFVKDNAFCVVLDNANLMEAIELTELEKASGVWVWVEISDVTDTISQKEAQIVIENIDDAIVGAYMNVELFKQIAGQEKTKITGTVEPIKITITVPDSIVDNNRTYAIVRVHDGEFEQITDFSELEDGNAIEFMSDKFSTYAIIYKDEADTPDDNQPDDNQPDDNQTDDNKTDDANKDDDDQTDDVQTGEENRAWAYVLMSLGLVFIVGTVVYRKKCY